MQAGAKPFPLLARTLWCIPCLSRANYESLIDDTVGKGFTAIEFFLPHFGNARAPYSGNNALPFANTAGGGTWNGNLSISADMSTPSEAYWSHVDGIIDYARSRTLAVLFFPAYVGYRAGYDGWRRDMVETGNSGLRRFGAWVAARYKDRGNLIWMIGGDGGLGASPFTAAETGAKQALIDGMATELALASTLISNEWNGDSIGTDQPDFGKYITVNGCYSWDGNTASVCRKGYSYSPSMPAFLQEGPFDGEGPEGSGFNPSASQPIRRFSWWAWLSAIAGYTFGNGHVWALNTGYTKHLDTTQTRHHAILNNFIRSIGWWSLVPSGLGGLGNLVPAGGGTMNTPSYVAAACDPAGALLVAYVGPGHTGPVTVDMSKMRGAVTAQWFDPTSGGYSEIGGTFINGGLREFTPPAANAAGQADWVLVLKS